MRKYRAVVLGFAICLAATVCNAQTAYIHMKTSHDFYPGDEGVSIVLPTTYDVVYDVPNPFYDPFAFGSTEPETVDVAMVAVYTVTNGTDSYPLYNYFFIGPDPTDPTLDPIGAPPDDPTIDTYFLDVEITDPDSSDDDFLIMSDSFGDLGWN